MFDIISLIPGKKKKTGSGWTSFNAVCCVHMGHRPDGRSRGGLKFEGNNWIMHCFNCGFSCSFTLGRQITDKTRKFLIWMGVDSEQVQRWSLESLQNRDLLDIALQQKKVEAVRFNTTKLPDGEVLDINKPEHLPYFKYLHNRSIDTDKYKFLVNPTAKDRKQFGIVVPYTFKKNIVGSTIRFIDDRLPKFLNDQQPGYVFNIDSQSPDWSVCIVTEGIFDALSIDGVAVMHDDISAPQATMLAQLNKRIIVVPDFDKTGLKLIDRALELGYSVSLPNWGPGIKDVNDAVVRYGKLATLLSILENATHSKIKLEMQRKKIINRITKST